ncbi:Ankyrin repeat protein [Aphelenchoides bicaudatus]|nr:Ankyrin repeat protein [Aphelenchoides bicaudatus]
MRLLCLFLIITTVLGDSTNITSELVIKALKNFNQEDFDTLLTNLNGTNWRNKDQETLLHIASKEGYFEAAKALIKKDPQLINSTSIDHWFPLHEASWYGKCDIVSLLLENGADVNALARYTRETSMYAPSVSALYLSIRAGHTECTKLLLNKGSRIDHQDHHGWSILHESCRERNYEIVRLLVQMGAKTSIKNEYNETPLDIAKLYKADEKILHCLEDKNCPNN